MNAPGLALLGGEPVRREPFPSWPIIGEAEINAVVAVLRRAQISSFSTHAEGFLGGQEVRAFEEAFAAYHGVAYAVAVNSGTAALHCALAAAGVGPGDEVIVPPYTFTATATSVLHHNAVPIFADVEARAFCLDPEAVKRALTPRTKAIMPVHLLGHPAEMDELLALAANHNLVVIEDCAQAPGARYKDRLVGTIGAAGAFSFQQTKNIVSGEGGMVITNDGELAERARLIRNHGESVVVGKSRSYVANIVGWNYRMTEMEAALGREQLKHLDEWNAARRRLSRYLSTHLQELEGLTVPYESPGVEHVYHGYGITVDQVAVEVDKDVIIRALQAEGIPVSGGYPHPLYKNPLFQTKLAYGASGCPFTCPPYEQSVSYPNGLCPVAEELCEWSAIWLFVSRPPATEADMDDIILAFRKVWDHREALMGVVI
ncbi:DegT/DnrJ/EryC1/StrS family aminotransferase [Nitrospinae bacterium AH_259_B05_G02_I21]|nr:DegT/DnrJ/EryC1/StrS family aminotransferase [Nitrospinae bacterium AH_259_B05_G02_I21]